ncbi:hypothetical protein EV401DRAFT_2068717 [Pisolithus croceorrhizus]|nr:hypothetical protein EV401DRAFT_2068717 [Pisolithus croceorrhizus]
MPSDVSPSTGGNSNPNPPFLSRSNKAIALPEAESNAPAAQPSQPTCLAPQVKCMGKCAQDPSAKSEGVQWKQLPYLTEKLLSWLLENPADHAILFNEKKDQTGQGNTAKPHAQQKKDIHVIIANFLFNSNLKYGDKYAANPSKFTSAMSTCLTRFKSTGEGISPDDPYHQNLREKVITEFPFWQQCDLMWHGNPSYDTKLFDVAPGTNQTGNFLSIIKNSGCAGNSHQQDESSEHHDNIPAPEGGPGIDWFGGTLVLEIGSFTFELTVHSLT